MPATHDEGVEEPAAVSQQKSVVPPVQYAVPPSGPLVLNGQ